MTLFFLGMLAIAVVVLTFVSAVFLSGWSYMVELESKHDHETYL